MPGIFILITLDGGGCNNCIMPVDLIVQKMHAANSKIPVFISTGSALTKEGAVLFSRKNNIDTALVKFLYDEHLNEYLLAKTKLTANIALVSAGEIITLQKLTTGDLEKVVSLILPELKIEVRNKIPVTNKYISLKKHCGFIPFSHSFFTYVPELGMISRYDYTGKALGDFFFDSLNISYLEFAKATFSTLDSNVRCFI